jgi:diguanylate cyclase (GGDEF)-like protein
LLNKIDVSYAEFFQYKLQVLNIEAPNGEHLEGRYKTLGLIMCDLGYFKQVNDQYGHNVGDLVLKETAS